MHLHTVFLHHTRFLVVVQDPQRHADIGGIKQVSRQDEDGLHLVVLDEFATDGQLGTIGTQSAVGQQETRHAVGREFGKDVQNPAVVGVRGRRQFVATPAGVVGELVLLAPVFLVERRIGHDVVGFQVFVLVVVEGVALLDVSRNATDSQIHARQLEGGVGVFLTINAHVLLVAMVGLHKLHRLHKHTT